MISIIMTILGLIPGLSSLVTTVTNKWFDTKVQITCARLGVDRDVAVAMLKTAAQAEMTNAHKLGIFASNPLLTLLLIAFAAPIAAFEWKVVVWDTMLGWGSTPAIHGQVADYMQTVIYFLFGAPTAMGIGKMWFGRNKTGE